MEDSRIDKECPECHGKHFVVDPSDGERRSCSLCGPEARYVDPTPHPEAREEDIEIIIKALDDMETAFDYKTYHDLESRRSIRQNEKEYYDARDKILAALCEPDGRKGE